MDNNDNWTPFGADVDNAPRWVGWILDPATDKKPPRDPKAPDKPAKTNDPATWGTRAQAERAASVLQAEGSVAGYGIVLGDLGDGTTMFGVDFDNCVAPMYENDPLEVAEWAQAIINRLGTYADIS